jgi:hypothetical protein
MQIEVKVFIFVECRRNNMAAGRSLYFLPFLFNDSYLTVAVRYTRPVGEV